MKYYPLELENIGQDYYQIMSKGHHNINDFFTRVIEEYGHWNLKKENIKYLYYKAIPSKEFRCYYVESSQSVRGAFPATYISE